MLKAKSIFATASTLAFMAAFPTVATAQGACAGLTGAERQACLDAEDDDAIVVTGSRIPRANFDTAQPAVVLGREQIEQRGYTNIGDALDELPAFGVPGNNAVGAQSGAFGSGQTFVNFFGLGDQRTLTVVNSRRFVSSNTSSIFGVTGAGSQVDFNVIPTNIIDRVETIAVGGAPIYGSDAIAGTVNVITKRNYSGYELNGQYGISEQGDAREYRVSGIAGWNFGDGRGNLTLSGEYNQAAGLTGIDRPRSGLNRFFTTPLGNSAFQQILIQDRRIPGLSEFGTPLVSNLVGFALSPAQAAAFGVQDAVTDANGNPLGFDVNGALRPIDFGQQTGNIINFDGGNGFQLPENLLTPTRRYLGVALAEFQITDNIRIFGEGWYANSRGTQLRDQPVYNTGLFDLPGTPDGDLIVRLDNPFLSAAARQSIVSAIAANPTSDQNLSSDPTFVQDYFYLGRANTDLATGEGRSQVELYRFVGGIDGNFEALGRQMNFELVGNYGRSVTDGRERVLVQQNFENAINAVRDASGNIVCAPGAVNSALPTLNSSCRPINPFGQNIDQAAIDYVTTFADPRAVNEQWVATASVSGSLFDVWGGPVGFALGYEHREESARFDPGEFYFGQVNPADPTGPRTQYGRFIPIDPVSGKFNTDEVFGELIIPLIGRDQNIPFIRSLELNGAFRYIDNSLAGGDPTYTLGAQWQPIEDITIRGNYTRSVRAPAVTELFNPTSQIFTTADDPCDSRFLNAGPDPATRQANCAAAGLGSNFQSNIVDFTARGTLQGNTALENEKANAWTVGAILRPRFLPNFTAAVDWIDIDLKGAIQDLDATQTLEACYDDPGYPSAICDQFTRDAGGQITFIQTGFANAASRKFKGLVAEVAWRTDTPFLGADSSISIGVNYLYNDTLEFRVGQGDLTTLRGGIGYSKHQATTNITYRNREFAWLNQIQYIGPARIAPDEPEGNRDFEGVDGVIFVNSTLSFNVGERFTLRFIVDNVFDTKPPFPAPTGAASRVTYFDGILGRYFKVGATARF